MLRKKIMNKRSFAVISLFVIPLFFGGCDSGTQNTQIQDVSELRWKADGSAIYGLVQSYIQTATSTTPSIGYSMARFNTDGSLAQTYSTTPLSRPVDLSGNIESFSPSLYVSSDGSTFVTQLEADLYRFHTQTAVLENLDQLFHLIVVSPDLHYAVGTTSPGYQPIKTIQIYDITTSPIRLLAHFDTTADVKPGLWLGNTGAFAITIVDSAGRHVSIYDTTGTLRNVIGGAETAFHNVVFNAQTNDIFVRNWAGKTTDQFLDKINLTTMARTNVLNFKVENFDVTKDEGVIIYSAYDTTSAIHMRSRNLKTLNELPIADDIQLIISLSPAEDKLAYIRKQDVNFNEIRVIPFQRP
jgi:hypothetical protein